MKQTAKYFSYGIVVCLSVLLCLQCKSTDKTGQQADSMINTSHLDSLYEEVVLSGDTVGVVHLYAEYPDYKWVGDDDEGYACVDDASRAAIFYLRQHKMVPSEQHLRKGRMLIKFLLNMQAPNGYYYNFLWPDGSIHKEGMTSKPEPNFWSWRTLWAFGEALEVLDSQDELVPMIKQQRRKLVQTLMNEPSFRSTATDTSMGWTFPKWLPKISGTDQAAIVIMGLTLMHEQWEDQDSMHKDSLVSFMNHFAEGIILMQIEQPDSFQNGAFLSWENLWHAYANVQSYALLEFGELVDDQHFIAHALYEIDNFYPALLEKGGVEHFSIRVDSGVIKRYETQQFSQIAYGQRPMIWGALKAFDVTKDEKYLTQARDLGAWFTGKNPANTPMYDPATGRGYDGINDATSINKNAGAESTIEALLSIQAMEMYAKDNDLLYIGLLEFVR